MRIPILTKKEDDSAVQDSSPHDASLQLHPVQSKDAILVKIQPPKQPERQIKHVASDIVLVIDISGSMSIRADIPGENPKESPGLSVLDLVKHAAMTIIESLGEEDRLGIVTFCSKSETVQELTVMTEENKQTTRDNIKNIAPLDSTNMWHGILDGIKLFNKGGHSSRIPSMMVLTDGAPNHMNPSKGYIPKMQEMTPFPAMISTFGFGYHLQSGLLKSIAEIGGGSYAFIPDAGMIGTVFVHAVANLQSTFATKAVLRLDYNDPLELEESTGQTADQHEPKQDGSQRHLEIDLGSLQYGQSRDIFLKVKNISRTDPFDENNLVTVSAKLIYKKSGNAFDSYDDAATEKASSEPALHATAQCSMLSDSDLAPNEVAYHESRSKICEFISSLFPLNGLRVHDSIASRDHGKEAEAHDKLTAKTAELRRLIETLPAKSFSDDKNQSLLKDLAGKEPQGQVSLALQQEYFLKWGQHYLLSLLNAHVRQACNTFKDPGPLQYGVDSPLFVTCRDHLDNVFDSLPAPEPSLPPTGTMLKTGERMAMGRYHNPAGVCFAGATPVELASGRTIAIRKLRRGIQVKTPAGPRKVAFVLKTPVEGETLCQVGGTYVTPWHPISTDGKTWAFPASVAQRAVRYTGCVYSIMLQRDANTDAHGIRVGDLWGVTLGHGLLRGDDVRAHSFFGDYNKVGKALVANGVKKGGIVTAKGIQRNAKSGLVTSFARSSLLGVCV